MKTRIQKWGNSLALRIPKNFAIEAGLENEAPVEVTLEGGKLVVIPLHELDFTLDDLLAKITAENLHKEIDTGSPVGNEIW